jgi:hypothetical protein
MNNRKAQEILKGMPKNKISFYTTSDDRVHTRYSDAKKHTNGKLMCNTFPLSDKTIREWYRD